MSEDRDLGASFFVAAVKVVAAVAAFAVGAALMRAVLGG